MCLGPGLTECELWEKTRYYSPSDLGMASSGKLHLKCNIDAVLACRLKVWATHDRHATGEQQAMITLCNHMLDLMLLIGAALDKKRKH